MHKCGPEEDLHGLILKGLLEDHVSLTGVPEHLRLIVGELGTDGCPALCQLEAEVVPLSRVHEVGQFEDNLDAELEEWVWGLGQGDDRLLYHGQCCTTKVTERQEEVELGQVCREAHQLLDALPASARLCHDL